MTFKILVASYTNDIYTLSFEPATSSLTRSSSVNAGFHPSWITSHPVDRVLVFACLEQEEGKVLALKYSSDGVGRVVGEASSGGTYPCSILASSDQLFVANYGSGSVSILSTSDAPPYFTPVATHSFTGSGPNTERQECSHAHQVFQAGENQVLVADLGGDRVYRVQKAATGQWNIQSSIQFPSGSGPRHVAIYEGFLYTLLELSSQVSRLPWPTLDNKPSDSVIRSTMSNPPSQPHEMLAAEILIPFPNTSYPIGYVYISNRNDPSPEGDTIAIFSTSDAFELIAEIHTGLNHARGMLFGGPDDKWLVVGGANGGGVKVFERVDGGRGLKEVAYSKDIEKPTGFLWL